MSPSIGGSGRVLADLDGAVAHLQRVVHHQPAEQRLADAGDQLDRLGHHDRADGGAQHAKHTALRAGRHHARRRRLGVEIAVLRAVLGPEHADLALEAEDRTPHVRLAEQHASVVDQVAGGEVVRAVQDQVVPGEDVQGVGRVQPIGVQVDRDQRVDLGDRLLGRDRLALADVGLAMDHLTLQVRLVDDIEVEDAEGADPGGGEVEQRRGPESARPDHQHLGVLQPLLPGHPDVGNDQVARVPLHLLLGQRVGRLDQRGKTHRHSLLSTALSACRDSPPGHGTGVR